MQYSRKISTQKCFRSQNKEQKFFKGLLFCLVVMLCAVQATNNSIDQSQWRYVATTSYCSFPEQASFHPTDPELVLIACSNTPYAFLLYSTAQNSLHLLQQLNTQHHPFGIQFSPTNGSMAVGVYLQSQVSLLQVSKQAINIIYDLDFPNTQYLMNIAFSPSGQYAAVLSDKCQVLYINVSAQTLSLLKNYTASQAHNCIGITYVNDDIILIGAGDGIYQYTITPLAISFQTQVLQLQVLSSGQYTIGQISVMNGYSAVGGFANIQEDEFISFDYQQKGDKSSLQPKKLLNLYYALSISFNSNNNKAILAGVNNISLYTYQCLYYNCYTCTQDGYCIACRNGYYSAGNSQNCQMKCNNGCLNCTNSTSCHSCAASNPPRIPDQFCACPLGFYSDLSIQSDCIEQNEDKDSGLPIWAIILIVVISVFIGGGLVFFGYRYYLKKKNSNNLNSDFSVAMVTDNVDSEQMHAHEKEEYNHGTRGQINATNDYSNQSAFMK